MYIWRGRVNGELGSLISFTSGIIPQLRNTLNLNIMLDIHIHITDKESFKDIIDKLDQVITLLKEDGEIEGLEPIIATLNSINEKVKTIV